MTAIMSTGNIPNIQQENFINAIFKSIQSILESGFQAVANKLIIELIHTLKSQNEEITILREDIYNNNTLALTYDTEEFYDAMDAVENRVSNLLQETQKLKDKSELLLELNDVVDDLYTNILQFIYQVGQISSEARYKQENENKLAS